MKVLLLVNSDDLNQKIFNKNLYEYNLEKFKKQKWEVVVYSQYNYVLKKLGLEFQGNLQDFLGKFRKKIKEENYLIVTKLAISSIDLDKVLEYHSNHKKICTLICKNLVHGKTTPIYKLNPKKKIVGINKKRYVSCGTLVLRKDFELEKFNTLTAFQEHLITQQQLKAFIYTGFFYTVRKIKRAKAPKGFKHYKLKNVQGFKQEILPKNPNNK